MNILDRIESDHEKFREMLSKLESEVLDSPRKYETGWTGEAGKVALDILNELLPAIRKHEGIEHLILFPAMAAEVRGAKEVLEEMEHEHDSLNELVSGFLRDLPKCERKPTSWMLLNVMKLMHLLDHHFQREEEKILSLAHREMAAGRLESLEREAQKIPA